jgi:PASTA domain
MKRLLLVVIMLITAACDDGAVIGATGSSITEDGVRQTGIGQTDPTFVPVPELVGESRSDARAALRAAGLRSGNARTSYSQEPPGTVVEQQFDPGTEVRARRRIRFTVAKPLPRAVFGNPWGYNFSCCRFIRDPPSAFCSYFKCVPYFSAGVGYVIQCDDRTFEQSGAGQEAEHPQGACSGRGGIYRPLLQLTGRYAQIHPAA